MGKQFSIEKSARNIGLDLLRILAMNGITTIHYFGYHQLVSEETTPALNFFLPRLITGLNGASVAAFVIISGYFLIDAKITTNRILNIWYKLWFCSMFFGIIGSFFGTFSGKNLCRMLFPIISNHYWFMVVYLLLLLLVPAINLVLRQDSGRVFFIFWCTAIFFTIVKLNPFIDTVSLLGSRQGLPYFVLLYMTGAYLKKFGVFPIPLSLLGFAITFLCSYLHLPNHFSFHFLDFRSVQNYWQAVFIFCLFAKISIKNGIFGGILTYLSSCSLFVYLFQENALIRSPFWKLISPAEHYNSPMWIVNLLCALTIPWCFAIVVKHLLDFLTPSVFSGHSCHAQSSRLWIDNLALRLQWIQGRHKK